MRKIILLLFTFLLSSCCVSKPQTTCPQTQEMREPTELEIQKAEERAAWEYAENEDLISAIEKSDPQKWMIGISKKIILAERYDIITNFRYNKVFFKMSIFSSGVLYLDNEKCNIGGHHRERLMIFFDKVLGKYK